MQGMYNLDRWRNPRAGLDLVEEEAKILRRCFTENAAGCYDGHAQTATDGHGCMLHKKA